MVEVIKNSLSRMEPRKANSDNAAPKTTSNSAMSAPTQGSVKLKSAENISAIKEMAASAPIDKVKVNSIKEAIQRGEYPIDVDRISDALLEAYKEMKSS